MGGRPDDSCRECCTLEHRGARAAPPPWKVVPGLEASLGRSPPSGPPPDTSGRPPLRPARPNTHARQCMYCLKEYPHARAAVACQVAHEAEHSAKV
jgi:hypothetical protein